MSVLSWVTIFWMFFLFFFIVALLPPESSKLSRQDTAAVFCKRFSCPPTILQGVFRIFRILQLVGA